MSLERALDVKTRSIGLGLEIRLAAPETLISHRLWGHFVGSRKK